MSAPWTVTVTIDAATIDYLEAKLAEEPAGPATLTLKVLRDDAAGIAEDDVVTVEITDNYDDEGITRTWLFYVQELKRMQDTVDITALGSEFWLNVRHVRTAKGPLDIGQLVKDYVDEEGAPITTGGVDTDTGRNAEMGGSHVTLLQLLEEFRQEGYRAFVKHVDALTPEELQFFRESTDFKAATRELAYGEG